MKKKDLPECPHICAYCEHAKRLQTNDQMLCPKKGVVEGGYSCHRFHYDPLKRNPHPQAPLPSFSKENFEL